MRHHPRWDPDLLLVLGALIVLLVLGAGIAQFVAGLLSPVAWVAVGTIVLLLLVAQVAIVLSGRDPTP